MSILVDAGTRVLVQGITGFQSRFDIRHMLAYGTKVVAGVTPGRGGEQVEGVPVFNTVQSAVAAMQPNTSIIYVPARGVRDAVLEAVEAGIGTMLATSENVPVHDAVTAVAAARAAAARLIGFNSNGVISPAKCKLGGIGGDRPGELYSPGRIGVCSRSGGMSAEIAVTLKDAGLGVSTCVSMGGDQVTGMRMVEYVELFEEDAETDVIVIFGEPGTSHEQELAAVIAAKKIRKPVIALIAGEFQERYPKGLSFGHVAAMIKGSGDSASEKRRVLKEAGALVAASLEEIPGLVQRALE